MEETRWMAEALRGLGPAALPLCNVGSSTRRFRTVEQPWIDELLFRDLESVPGAVVHVDTREDESVDVVGDVREPVTRARVQALGPRSVMCCNLLEHVEDPPGMARSLVELIPPGGHLLVSCPRSYPYHADPIDNGLRPSPVELAELFPGTEVVAAAEVPSGTYLDSFRARPWAAFKGQVFTVLPLVNPEKARSGRDHLRWLRREFVASCLVLRKGPTGTAEP